MKCPTCKTTTRAWCPECEMFHYADKISSGDKISHKPEPGRLEIAAMLMAAVVAAPQNVSSKHAIETSLRLADALIKAHNETKEKV